MIYFFRTVQELS